MSKESKSKVHPTKPRGHSVSGSGHLQLPPYHNSSFKVPFHDKPTVSDLPEIRKRVSS